MFILIAPPPSLAVRLIMLTGLFKNSRDRSEFLYLTKCLTLCEQSLSILRRKLHPPTFSAIIVLRLYRLYLFYSYETQRYKISRSFQQRAGKVCVNVCKLSGVLIPYNVSNPRFLCHSCVLLYLMITFLPFTTYMPLVGFATRRPCRSYTSLSIVNCPLSISKELPREGANSLQCSMFNVQCSTF